MSKHTPGPWSAEHAIEYAVFEGRWSVWNDGATRLIANVLLTSDETDKADAHLIAAAPDLLAACEALLAGSSKAAPLARIAVAKAKGEKP